MIRYSTQWIAALGGVFVLIQLGLHNGWSSPNIIRLSDVNSEIPITEDQISWLVSIPSVSELAGVFIGSISHGIFGSKNIAILVLLFFSVNWICLIIANSIVWIFAARIISGVACGMISFYYPFHVGDVSSPKIRGTLIALGSVGAYFGLVLSTIAENYLTMKISSSIYLIQCLLTVMLFLWLKGSPYEFAMKEKYKLAKVSIAFYNPEADSEKELNDVRNFVQLHNGQNFKDKLGAFKISSMRRSLFLVTVLYSFPYLSGIATIIPYMEVILIKAKFNIIKPGDLVIYIYITRTLSALSTATLVDILGRRIALILTGIGTSLGMAGLGLHFYLLSLNFDAGNLQWLPIIVIILYFLLFGVGYGSVPNAIMSELFPASLKITVMLLTSIWTALLSFTFSKSFLLMADLVGEIYVFWLHAVFSLLTIPFALFLLPETKGKTFQEIQCDLDNK